MFEASTVRIPVDRFLQKTLPLLKTRKGTLVANRIVTCSILVQVMSTEVTLIKLVSTIVLTGIGSSRTILFQEILVPFSSIPVP